MKTCVNRAVKVLGVAAMAALLSMVAFPLSASATPAQHPEGAHGNVPEWSEFHVWDDHHHHHHHVYMRQSIFSEVAKMLGLSETDLAKALKDKTLAEIAAEKGISEKELIAKLKSLYKQKIDEAVKEGKIDKAKAKKLKSNMDEHLRHLVHRKLYEHKQLRPIPHADKLASMLGMSREELIKEWKQGKSLVEIAEARGIDKEQLISKIKEELTPWIQSMVERKARKAD